MKAYLINRDQDKRRLDFVMSSASRVDGIELERVSAIDAYADGFRIDDYLPEELVSRSQTINSSRRGDIREKAMTAVFLSHAKCWGKIAEAEERFGLVLEDDVEILPGFEKLSADLEELDNFDSVFVNGRARQISALSQAKCAPPKFHSIVDACQNYFSSLSMGKIFDNIGSNIRPGMPPGGEGYLLSREGAAKLLEYFNCGGGIDHADFYIFLMGLPQELVDLGAKYSPTVDRFRRSMLGSRPAFSGFIYSSPVVFHRPQLVGGSVRNPDWRPSQRPRDATAQPPASKSSNAGVIIHIGVHKAGSTSIQSRLDASRSILEGRFAIFHQGDNSTLELRKACQALHRSFVAKAPITEAQEQIRLSARDMVELSRNRKILVSDEELAGFMVGRGGTRRVYPALEEIALTLVKSFAPLAVSFVVYEREPISWLRSAYNQAVKHHRLGVTFDVFERQVFHPESVSKTADRLRRLLGEESVRSVDFVQDANGKFGLGERLFRIAGLDDTTISALPAAEDSNSSLNHGALELIRRLNQTRLENDALRIVRQTVIRNQGLFAASPPEKSEE